MAALSRMPRGDLKFFVNLNRRWPDLLIALADDINRIEDSNGGRYDVIDDEKLLQELCDLKAFLKYMRRLNE